MGKRHLSLFSTHFSSMQRGQAKHVVGFSPVNSRSPSDLLQVRSTSIAPMPSGSINRRPYSLIQSIKQSRSFTFLRNQPRMVHSASIHLEEASALEATSRRYLAVF